jgi:hypothetical protein
VRENLAEVNTDGNIILSIILKRSCDHVKGNEMIEGSL